VDGAFRRRWNGACPRALAAITLALLTAVKSGDHILVTDAVYRPSRIFCDTVLTRMGVETSYYDPTIGASIDSMIRPNTSVIFVEAPGSQSFEVQDVPAIAALARARGICTILDNTWATPLFFPPHARGADMAVEAGTKYLGGHSDLLIGLVSANPEWFPRLRATFDAFAMCAGPGMFSWFARTSHARPPAARPSVRRSIWPAGSPPAGVVGFAPGVSFVGSGFWKRDFLGSSGLFSILLSPCSAAALAAMLDGLKLFGMGYSWGGFRPREFPSVPDLSQRDDVESRALRFPSASRHRISVGSCGVPGMRTARALNHDFGIKIVIDSKV
jgi:cystathionine beta-lyase